MPLWQCVSKAFKYFIHLGHNYISKEIIGNIDTDSYISK